MGSIVAEYPTQPRPDIGSAGTFYRMIRGSVVIDVCAGDLAAALEKDYAQNPHIRADAELAERLRGAIASSIALVRESDLSQTVADRALYQLADILRAGGYRITEGGEAGSSLVVGVYSFSAGGSGDVFAGGGVVFFWSKSRKPIFSVNCWIT